MLILIVTLSGVTFIVELPSTEIVSYDDLVASGSVAAAREKGQVRVEGKDYIMQDGDVTHFRFNV